MNGAAAPRGVGHALETLGAWLLGVLWALPLAYAVWTAFHPAEFSTRFVLTAPLTLDNFVEGLGGGAVRALLRQYRPARHHDPGAQLVLCTLAGYAFARFDFAGRTAAFLLVLVQLMILPDVLIVENYRTMSRLGLLDTLTAIGLPYMASAFGIFLLRQTFKTVPKELDEAARVEGAGPLEVLWRVYVPLARPVYLAYGLVSISYHWNNFLWPLIVTNSVQSRPLTVGLQVFSSGDQGVDWSIITAATLMTSGPLLIGSCSSSASSCRASCAPASASTLGGGLRPPSEPPPEDRLRRHRRRSNTVHRVQGARRPARWWRPRSGADQAISQSRIRGFSSRG